MKIRWFDMSTVRPIGTFVFNIPIRIVSVPLPCFSRSPRSVAQNLASLFPEFPNVEQRELQLQATRRKESLRKRGLAV